MPKYDVKLRLEDEEQEIRLEVYQQVVCSEAQPDEEIVKRAKNLFRVWAEGRGPDWDFLVARLPHATLRDSDIRVYS